MQYIEAICLIDTVDETPGDVCLTWSTNDEVDDSLRKGTIVLEQGGQNVEEWFGIEYLEALQGFLNVLTGNHAISPFS